MEANQLLSADLLDILFEGRNKKYGAYMLRKTYPQRLTKAMFVVLLLFSGISMVLLNTQPVNHLSTAIVVIPEPELHRLPLPKPVDPVKPQTRTVPSRQKGHQKKYVSSIMITKDSTVQTDTLRTMLDTDAPGDATTHSVHALPLGGHSEGKVNSNNHPADSVHHAWQSFIKDEKDAAFPGGIASWKKFLQRQVDADIPVLRGAPEGVYTVMVEFTVRTTGELYNVRAVTHHGYGMEDEAVRVIKRGPKWIPASQNGKYVETYRRQPVTFLVQSQQ